METTTITRPKLMVKASITVMSHLSDAQVRPNDPMSKHHINFAKYIILQTNGNLNKEVDVNTLWEKYCEMCN
jgi:hypothetical protein